MQSDLFTQQLKALADPKRMRIINLLMDGVQCNCELGERLGMSNNLISHHLRVLREAGFVDVERDEIDARWVYYSLNQRALDDLIGNFSTFFNPARIQSRHPQCGPRVISSLETDALVTA